MTAFRSKLPPRMSVDDLKEAFALRPSVKRERPSQSDALALGDRADWDDCALYVAKIYGTNLLKVGVSVDPKKRLAAMQTGSPFDLGLIFEMWFGEPICYSLESRIHKIAKEQGCHIRGEWLHMDASRLGSAIDAMTARFALTPRRVAGDLTGVTDVERDFVFLPANAPRPAQDIIG